MDEYDAYDGYDDWDGDIGNLVEGKEPYSLDENLIERVARPPNPGDNFEGIDPHCLELNGLNDYSDWYTLAAPFFEYLAPVRVYNPLFDPIRAVLSDRVYDYIERLASRYGGDDSFFFSLELLVEHNFALDVGQLDELYDSISDNLLVVPNIQFFSLSFDPLNAYGCRVLICGAVTGVESSEFNDSLMRILSMFSNFTNCVLESFKITQDAGYFENFLCFLVSRHQHPRYRYVFVNHPTSASVPDPLFISMHSWFNHYCNLYGGGLYCGEVTFVSLLR